MSNFKNVSFQRNSLLVKIPLTKDINDVLKKVQGRNHNIKVVRHFNGNIHCNDMLDVDDLDYEPENEDGLMEKMNRINQTEDSLKIRQKNILRDFKSGSLSYGSLSHMGKTFRDKIKSFNVHVGVEGSFRNKYVPYSKSEEKQFLDSSSEDENSSQSHVEKSKSCGESDLSESLKSDSYQFSNESLPFNEPQNVNNLNTECDDYSDCTSKQSANQSTAQSNKNMAVKKETAVVEKKKCSKNFTITLTGSSRLLNHKKRFKKWDVQVEDVLKDDVMKLTYLESVFQFTAEAENDSHSTLGSQRSQTTEKSTFKLPLRRPPTRQKTTAKNLSVSVDLNLNKTKVTSVGNLRELPTISDDVLSLIASTTIEEEKEQENALHTGDSYNIPNNTVKRSENVEMDKVKHWLNSQHNDRTTTFIDYSNVPDIYKGLCYQYFFNASCTRWDRCRNSHNLNGSLSKLNKIGELNDDDLREAHNFAISRPSFYGKIYKYFTKVFAKKDMKSELINIVHTIFDKQLFSIDSVEGLTDILDCLEQTDLGTFEDSVEYLLLEVNIKQFPILGSIIFEVICNKQNICHYWPIIRRLVLIGEKMSVKLGTKFLVKLMKTPVDIKLCKNADQLIQKYAFVNLNEIASDTVKAFRQLCTEEETISTTIEENNAVLHTDYSHNVPNNTVKRTENVEMDKVEHWLNTQHDERSTTIIDYSNVPDIYKGLCYKYFFNGRCHRSDRCINSHNLNGSLSKLHKIDELSDEELRGAYNFALSRPSFYGKIYKYFTKAFAKRGMKSELINIVHIVFDKDLFSIHSVEGLTDILDCLEKTDLGTFEDSVDYLLLEVNIKQFPMLGSVIFEVICNKENLPICYWPIIRRLVLIGEKMSVKLGTKFLVKLMKMPVDINFCKNVDQLIQKYEFVNLNEIASDIVKAFRQVCTQEETTSTVSKNNQVEFQHTLLNREQQTQNKPKSAPVIFSPPNLTSQNETFGNNCDFSIDSSKDCDLRTFGENVSECQDFASLCFKLPSSNYRNNNLYVPKQQTSTLNPSQAFLHAKRSLDQSSNESIFRRSFDSDGGDSRICPLLSDSSSFENSSGCSSLQNFGIGKAYNKDGLFYDPTNDYVPSAKKPKLVLSLDQYHQRNANQDRYKPKSQSSTSESESGMAQEYFDQDIRNVLVNLRVNEEELFQNNSNNRMDKVREYNGPQQRNLPSFRFPKNRSNISLTANSINNYRLSEKPPEQPLFGKLPFNPDYELNISLHHLYLEQIDNIDLDEADIFALNNCIIKADGKTFLNFVEKYKGPMTIQNFISMTLAHLIGRNQMMAEVFVALLTSIENYNPHYYANVSIKVVLEVIIMNFLFELEKRNLFNATRKLLLKFSDWDSLVSSRLFINKNISLIGRYLFIAKLFVHTEPELTYEIMICPKFHLLEDCSKWPYDLTPSIPGAYQTDLELRNMILHIFFTESFLLNPIVVIQLYKTALKTGISHFDVKPFIEMMVITLVNRNNRVSLKQVLNELDLFSRYLKKSTMRAFLVIMAKHTNILDVYRLFDKCVERGIYQRLFRAEAVVHTVYIKTDMPDDEIELIIRYYFSKLVQLRNLPPGSETLKFDIGLPGQIENLPILQCCRSIVTVNAIVRHYIMAICSLEAKSSTFSLVEIKKDDLIKYLEKNRSKI